MYGIYGIKKIDIWYKTRDPLKFILNQKKKIKSNNLKEKYSNFKILKISRRK